MPTSPINPVEKKSGGKGGLLGKILGGVAGAVASIWAGPQAIPVGMKLGEGLGTMADPGKVEGGGAGPNNLEIAAQHTPEVVDSILSTGKEELMRSPLFNDDERKEKLGVIDLAINKNKERLR